MCVCVCVCVCVYSMSILFYLSIGSEEVLLYFSSCFWFTPETPKQDGNKFIILN